MASIDDENEKKYTVFSKEFELDRVNHTLGQCWDSWFALQGSRRNVDEWKKEIWQYYICKPELFNNL